MANSVVDQVAAFLLGKGLTREQTAGVLGNLAVESGFRTDAVNQGEGAIGLAQWRLGRRDALQALAAKMGGSETDLNVQLQFLWRELTTPGMEPTAMLHLAQATTPAAAAEAFDKYYERSDGNARALRISKANEYYPKLGPGAGDSGYKWDPATGYASVGIVGGKGGEWTAVPASDDGGSTWHGPLDFLPGGGFAAEALDQSGISLKGFIIGSLFVIGGMAIVAIGLAQAVKPAATKAKDAAVTVIDTAKTATPARAL